MSASPDLSGLTTPEAWEHWHTVEATALTAARARMGSDYASSPSDTLLKAAMARARDTMEGATGRFFTARAGSLSMDGTGTYRLFCPYPIVSENQLVGAGVTQILIGDDTTALEADTYQANDGIGLSGRDPRAAPWVEFIAVGSGGTFVSRPPGFGGYRNWPGGVRNVHVTATWGYLDANGATPDLVLELLAKLTIRALTANDDTDAISELHDGAVTSESTRDRSISWGDRAQGGGVTTDREIDVLIAHFKAPPMVRVPGAPGRRVRSGRDSLLSPVRRIT